jgi:hypothetical protein
MSFKFENLEHKPMMPSQPTCTCGKFICVGGGVPLIPGATYMCECGQKHILKRGISGNGVFEKDNIWTYLRNKVITVVDKEMGKE